jgi:hypothetical protein
MKPQMDADGLAQASMTGAVHRRPSAFIGGSTIFLLRALCVLCGEIFVAADPWMTG